MTSRGFLWHVPPQKKYVKATSATSCPGRMEPQAAKAPPETDLEDLWPVAGSGFIHKMLHIVIVIHYNYMFFQFVGFVGCKSARRSNFNSCRMKMDLLDLLKLLSCSIHFHPHGWDVATNPERSKVWGNTHLGGAFLLTPFFFPIMEE